MPDVAAARPASARPASSRPAPSRLDPVTLEILFNALRGITDETFIALMRTAYSTNIKERHDHSTVIMDADGRLVVQADGSLPIHLASMLGLMRCLLAKVGKDGIRPGDIFVANDPHVAGGTHLPDINLAMPVFGDGDLLGFVCNIAHHADVGGMVPGSMAGGMSEIYQEGLRIPVVRLFAGGTLQQDVMDILLLNMRLPEERRGDLNAQIAACRLGAARLQELWQKHGTARLSQAFDQIVARTAQRMRQAIARIPNGVYRFEDVMDDDGMGAKDIPIRLAITVGEGGIHFDFAGSSPQVRGNINLTLNATQSAVCYALKALLDPEVPNNQGVLDAFTIAAPSGSLLNCQAPAPVAARAHTCQRVIDVVIGALAPVLPAAAVAAANGANTTAVFAGTDPRTGRAYVYFETLGGGFGGRADRDGKDGVQVHITNTSNLPIEAIEMEYPLQVVRYGLVEDSGGAGTWRGGMGLRREVKPVGHACTFNGAGERFTHQPWGIFGGEPGASGRFLLRTGNGAEQPLDNKPAGVSIAPSDSVVVETPGAGGYGPPSGRSAEALAADARGGKFSAAYRRRYYGSATS
ncbi:MAG: hydantoinase B/oxoprolinase family protein [Alphaproteobacteria bacterium]|nr:hydantoinase B/oxoprolinase family protein [Alphaproteobacteria bacterium]